MMQFELATQPWPATSDSNWYVLGVCSLEEMIETGYQEHDLPNVGGSTIGRVEDSDPILCLRITRVA